MATLEQLAFDISALRIEVLEDMREACQVQDKDTAEYYSERLDALVKGFGATLALLEALAHAVSDAVHK